MVSYFYNYGLIMDFRVLNLWFNFVIPLALILEFLIMDFRVLNFVIFFALRVVQSNVGTVYGLENNDDGRFFMFKISTYKMFVIMGFVFFDLKYFWCNFNILLWV